MHKEILRVLLDKPELYLKAWVWMYSRVDDGGVVKFSYADLHLMGKVKVSEAVLKSIFRTHLEWNRNKRYTNIEPHDGIYTVTFYETPLEMTEEEKLKVLNKLAKKEEKKEIKRKLTDEQLKLRNRCIGMYQFFYEQRIGIKPLIDGTQMENLDKIIKHFQSTGKADTDERVMLAFKLVYDHWDQYPEHIRNQYSLRQIATNLNNMLGFITENKKKSKLGKVTEVGNKINDAIESGAMDRQIANLGKR